MVVARQRPETAKGIVFMLIEDEVGVVNLIVPARVYDRSRAVVRAAPLVRSRGKLERREGTINVLITEIAELERDPTAHPTETAPAHPPSPARRPRREPGPGTTTRRNREFAVAELRAVAPSGHSFGRRG
jgi:error-prone DNA polymerase